MTDPSVEQKIGTTVTEETKKQEVRDELVQTLGESHELLVSATTVFPFTLFPDTITVDRAKVTITRRNFFWAGEVISIAIEDVLNATATVGPFFGTVKLTTRFFGSNKPYSLNFFWKEDALRIARIMQGYIIARQQNIDTSVLSLEELTQKLDDLGKAPPDEKF